MFSIYVQIGSFSAILCCVVSLKSPVAKISSLPHYQRDFPLLRRQFRAKNVILKRTRSACNTFKFGAKKLTQIIVATWPLSGITFTTKNVGTLCVAVPFFGRAFCPISLGLWTLGKNELHKLLSDSGPYPYANP